MRKIDTHNFRRATRTTPREINRRIALNLIREHQPISRADLARRMGIRRGMVTSLVNELLSDRQIYEGATADAPRGRKPTLLHIRTRDRLVVAVEVRASQTRLMLSDFGGRDVAGATLRTPLSPEELVTELSDRIEGLLEAHGELGFCEGIGVVIPGMVERTTGRILNAPTLGWRNVDFRAALEARLGPGLPIHVERDAVACALAKMWLGKGGGEAMDSFVYLTVSDGVGAGLVVGGEVVRGDAHAAGEFGHIPLTLDGPYCSCGSRGCLEAYTSDAATLARYFRSELATRETHLEVLARGTTVADVVALARAGDGAALEALQSTARYIGIGIAGIINALNPARVIVGGEVVGAWDLLERIVRQSVAERTLTEDAAATPIAPDPVHDQVRLRGATALVVAPAFAAPQLA